MNTRSQTCNSSPSSHALGSRNRSSVPCKKALANDSPRGSLVRARKQQRPKVTSLFENDIESRYAASVNING